MAKTRFAKSPPDCQCLEAANDKLKKKMGKGYRKLEKYNKQDGHWRKIWMDAYIDCIKKKGKDPKKYIIDDDPKYEPGTLKQYCKPKPEKEKKATIIVRVWWKKEKQPSVLLSDVEVQHAVSRILEGPKKKSNYFGEAVFSPVKPGTHTFLAWKYEKTYIYEMNHGSVSIAAGETKVLDIELERVSPTTVFVEVLDCEKKRIRDVDVTLGTWSQQHNHPIPFPGKIYETKKTNSKGSYYGKDITDEAVFEQVTIGKYRAFAKKTYKHKIYRYGDKEHDIVKANIDDLMIKSSGGMYELSISHCLKSQSFSLYISNGLWWVLSLPLSRPALKKLLPKKIADLVGVSILVVQIDLSIKNVITGDVSKYRSDWATLLKWGASTPGLLPADRVKFKGKGWSNAFSMPAFIGDRFVNEKSFSGDVGLQLEDVTGLGMCMNITFYHMPGRNMIQGLILSDLKGLPDLPSIGNSATGTGRTVLTLV